MKTVEEQINELKQNPKDKWIKQSVHRLSGYDKGLNDALALLKKAKGLLYDRFRLQDIEEILGKFDDKCECDMCGGLMVIDPDCPIHGKEKS